MKKFNRFMADLPLGSKLAGLTGLLIVSIILALTITTVRREQISFQSELESQAELLLETLPRTMRDNIYRIELDELLDIASVVIAAEDVVLVKIYDDKGALLVDAEDAPLYQHQEATREGQDLVELRQGAIELDWQTESLVAGAPIYLGNDAIGAVQIGLSTRVLNEKISAMILQNIVVAVISLGVSLLFAILFARQITNPLSELANVATEMAGGNLSKRVAIEGSAEVGQLGKAFNQMATSIQKRDTDLRELTASLEKTVEERTEELRSNVQELVKTNAELTVARRKAEEATQLKSQFLASMSHELRTPLNAIMGFSQLLTAGVSGELNDKQKEKSERILKNAQTLLELINDVLDLSKIEAGRTELIKRKFVVSTWMNSITLELEGLANKKGITLKTILDDKLPDEIIGDSSRLKQIATNLISNGIKFTEDGEVHFEVKQTNKDTWSIIVTDTGIGISPHMQEVIFEEFRQVDGTSQKEYGGTGLGLSIVRKLAILMGGNVRVSSKIDEGSTFTVNLPLEVREKV